MRGSRRTRLTLVLLLLTAFTLTALDYNSAQSGPLAALRRGIDTVFGPVQRAVGSAADSVGSALGGLPRLGSYQSENKKLRRENDALKGQLAAQSGLECSYKQLVALHDFVQFSDYPTVPAHVTGVGASSDFESTVTIDVGEVDGITPAMTVVTGYGLVGRTLEVSKRTTTVLLLRDPQSEVGGNLVGYGLIGFTRGQGTGNLLLSLPLSSGRESIKKGTVVVTTGSIYQPGIPIGTVTATAKDPNGTVRTGTLVPFVNSDHLDLVGVIKGAARTQPRNPMLPVRPTASSTPCPQAVPNGPVPTSRPSPTPSVTGTPGTTPSTSTSPTTRP